MFVDTHTHIYTEDFDADRKEVLLRAREAGAAAMILPNINAETLPQMLALSEEYPGVCYPTIGLHPEDVREDYAEVLAAMEAHLTEHHPFVAIGEIGVDLYWDETFRAEQLEAFRIQAEWAARERLPLIIHTRKAHREVIDTLLPLRGRLAGGIFHCFGGTAEEAEELLTFPDFFLGIGGVVTFKKSTLPEVLRTTVPLERIVLETDAPYLAPAPHRGKRNEPSFIPYIIGKLAEVYETTPEVVEKRTTANAFSLFSALRLAESK